MLKIICLSVLLYIACLSNIVDGRRLRRAEQRVSQLEKARDNLRTVLDKKIGEEIVVNGETYVLEKPLGVVPGGVSAHHYHQYWNDADFLRSAFIQLKFVVKEVEDVDTVAPTPTEETYVYSQATKLGKGTFGIVYGATKYTALGAKDTTKSLVAKVVINQVGMNSEASLAAAVKECDEYKSVPDSVYLVKCYGTALSGDNGVAILDNGGPDINGFLKNHDATPAERKAIVKGMLTAVKLLNTNKKTHRDVKPDNACFKDNQVKLIDFGLMVDWDTECVLAKVGALPPKTSHGTGMYKWPDSLQSYSAQYKTNDETKQEFVDLVKSKLYLVDMGGVFATHLKLITKYENADIVYPNSLYGTDAKGYYSNLLKKVNPTIWVEKSIGEEEKAVLLALNDKTKTLDNVLAMEWFED